MNKIPAGIEFICGKTFICHLYSFLPFLLSSSLLALSALPPPSERTYANANDFAALFAGAVLTFDRFPRMFGILFYFKIMMVFTTQLGLDFFS